MICLDLSSLKCGKLCGVSDIWSVNQILKTKKKKKKVWFSFCFCDMVLQKNKMKKRKEKKILSLFSLLLLLLLKKKKKKKKKSFVGVVVSTTTQREIKKRDEKFSLALCKYTKSRKRELFSREELRTPQEKKKGCCDVRSRHS